MGSYLKYFLKRVFFMLITLWLIATITFFLMQLLPGTPYTNQERLSPETIAMLNKQVGLDKPVIVQYGIYLSNLVQGNFGIPSNLKIKPFAALISWSNRSIIAIRFAGNRIWYLCWNYLRHNLSNEAKFIGPILLQL